MANKFELDRKAVGRFLKSPEAARGVRRVVEPIRDRAEANARAAARPGENPQVDLKEYIGRDRVRFHVAMVNPAAIKAEQIDRALTRAKPAGGR
ncbi:hypothetical protein [Kocuria rhizophila]|uniref:hypothetical protein n=1 Tax=Kocuria rhizophila TaxID=72000 RepID=UPI00190A1549|nr:hypothetical protein [Kocuria rhizophila]MBK4119724.1 hypothetical protein [Kocuria rhizophila]